MDSETSESSKNVETAEKETVISLGDMATFRLTSKGKAILAAFDEEERRKLAKFAPRAPLFTSEAQINDDGSQSMQLFRFMNIFGGSTLAHQEPVVENNELKLRDDY